MKTNKMNTDIFIKTCKHDAPYLGYCLDSIRKFCTGFRDTGFRDTVVIHGEHPEGYLWQQVEKMYADNHTDADFILVTDSDTLFNQPVTPESFMRDGRPIWIHTPWTEEMLAHPGTATWKRVMTAFAKESPPSEFMRRQPFVFPRAVLPSLREFCLRNHGITLADYIMQSQSFSEWNVLGFHCWTHHRDLFHWIDSSVDELPPLFVRQFWSHDPIEKNLAEIQSILS
jgi:hypothetical protein